MREIKFRAWDINNREMHMDVHEADGSSEFITFNNNNEMVKFQPASFSDYLYFDFLIVMQSVGLRDKNGIEVYEEDILELTHVEYEGIENTELIVVGIIEEGLELVGLNEFYGSEYSARELLDIEFEIVGNKFENPELLEESE